MRSIFSKILFWVLGTIVISLAGALATSMVVSARLPGRMDFIAQTQQAQLEGARQVYELGGALALADYLDRLNSVYRARHVVVDAKDRDLVDGQNRSDLVARAAPSPWPRVPSKGPIVLSRTTDDGAYRFLILLPPPFGPLEFLPYFLWIVLVVLILGYLLAMHLARPLRALRLAVERFGRGELGARFGLDRRDEIGELGRAFDHMAGQIETLLTAERRLLQDVSHELRSPLTRLSFALELARTAEDREAALARARKEANRLADLVDELLQLTRAEGDPAARVREPVALEPLLRELAEDCALEAEAKGGAVTVRCDRDVIVPGDPELLRRAVENAVRNAIRHAPDRTDVEVRLAGLADRALITVRDRGPGVDPDHLDNLFKPFFRVENDRNRTSGGVGLGLAIARRAVELHQGTITAANAHPGLAIVIELPCGTHGLP